MRNASFIFRMKAGSFHEFKFEAKDLDDLFEKERFFVKTMMGQITGSICGWEDAEELSEYRENVSQKN